MTRFLKGWAYALAFLLVTDAFAQTPTQPVYVRQAKNPTVTLFDNAAVGATPAGLTTRLWTTDAFQSAILTVNTVSGNCGDLSTTQSWEIPGIAGYVRGHYISNVGSTNTVDVFLDTSFDGTTFTTLVRPAWDGYFRGVGADCVVDIYMTLVPFSSSVTVNGSTQAILQNVESSSLYPVVMGGVVANTNPTGSYKVYPLAVNASGNITPATPTGAATAIPPNSITTVETVYSFDGTKRVTLQNNGTGAMLCAVTSNVALAVDSTNYDFSLAASSAVNDGTGGSITLPYIPLTAYYLRCVALSGTAIAAGFAHL